MSRPRRVPPSESKAVRLAKAEKEELRTRSAELRHVFEQRELDVRCFVGAASADASPASRDTIVVVLDHDGVVGRTYIEVPSPSHTDSTEPSKLIKNAKDSTVSAYIATPRAGGLKPVPVHVIMYFYILYI